ncbi:hypothetical protein GGF32_005258 [Allomyces javanicus]|nr:hypothetical protein GGF32_005258 [Allomyces javanicus]
MLVAQKEYGANRAKRHLAKATIAPMLAESARAARNSTTAMAAASGKESGSDSDEADELDTTIFEIHAAAARGDHKSAERLRHNLRAIDARRACCEAGGIKSGTDSHHHCLGHDGTVPPPHRARATTATRGASGANLTGARKRRASSDEDVTSTPKRMRFEPPSDDGEEEEETREEGGSARTEPRLQDLVLNPQRIDRDESSKA